MCEYSIMKIKIILKVHDINMIWRHFPVYTLRDIFGVWLHFFKIIIICLLAIQLYIYIDNKIIIKYKKKKLFPKTSK